MTRSGQRGPGSVRRQEEGCNPRACDTGFSCGFTGRGASQDVDGWGPHSGKLMERPWAGLRGAEPQGRGQRSLSPWFGEAQSLRCSAGC